MRGAGSQLLDILDVLAMLVNAAVFFGISFRLVEQAFGRREVAVVSLGLAAFYTAHLLWFLRRRDAAVEREKHGSRSTVKKIRPLIFISSKERRFPKTSSRRLAVVLLFVRSAALRHRKPV